MDMEKVSNAFAVEFSWMCQRYHMDDKRTVRGNPLFSSKQ